MQTTPIGMNPHLEASHLWQGFHNKLISETQTAFNRAAPQGYVAVMEQRLVIFPDEQQRQGDVVVRSTPDYAIKTKSSTSVLELGAPDGIVRAIPEDTYDWFIEIRTSPPTNSRVVTIIEVLSPSNKAAGSLGRREYKQKQRELMAGDTHLLEIDLLRFGTHTVATPLENLPPRDTWDYIVSLHRYSQRYHTAYWLNRISQPLPTIQVPLLPGDNDVLLNLEQIYQETYERGGFASLIELNSPIT